MPRFHATCATECPDSRATRTASSLNASVYDRRVFVLMLPSDFIILLLTGGACKIEGRSDIY
jgi:hypothetical protein